MTLARLLALVAATLAVSACGGGGASYGGGTIPLTGGSGSNPGSSPSSAPGTKPSAVASAAPSAPASAAGPVVPSASASPVTVAGQAIPAPTSPPDAPGYTNAVPPTPTGPACRAGQTYNIYISTPTGDREAFTVFEPATLCGNKTYPLVMWGPGYSSSRQTTTASSPGGVSPGNIGQLVAANYGVISIDERGFGEDTGTVRSMDPNFEGRMDLSVMDWAQANLGWIAYGPTLEGDDAHEPVMGSIGGSYGGMYQMLLLAIDPRHRLHAIVPQIAPNDLNYSLYPNGVIKDGWDIVLYGAGQSGGSGVMRGNTDPFITNATTQGLQTQMESPAAHDFFGYHSNSYWCNGASIGSDGDVGSKPLFAPQHPPKINAMMWQGMRDTLFTFNNAYANAACYAQGGGDVRVLSYQSGHNTLQAVPDPYVNLYYPAGDFLDSKCGSLSVDDATLAFFDQYLKGVAGAASKVPTQPCLSIQAGDAVLVPSVITGKNGTPFAIPATAAVAGGTPPDAPLTVALGPAFTTAGVIGGLPHMDLTVTPLAATGEPFLYFGVGLMHASKPGAYDLLDNQLTPIRGAGEHDLDMTGIAARYQPGDQLALLIYGAEDQYYGGNSTANPSHPGPVAVSVAGTVWVPFAANATTAP